MAFSPLRKHFGADQLQYDRCLKHTSPIFELIFLERSQAICLALSRNHVGIRLCTLQPMLLLLKKSYPLLESQHHQLTNNSKQDYEVEGGTACLTVKRSSALGHYHFRKVQHTIRCMRIRNNCVYIIYDEYLLNRHLLCSSLAFTTLVKHAIAYVRHIIAKQA